MTYIVYCTICTENKYLYVGVHRTADCLKFDGYIGCGVNVHNAASYAHPKTKFLYAVKTYGPKKFLRIILAVFDNEEDAYSLEESIVTTNFLSRPDVYNLVLGGKTGVSNFNSIPCYQYTLEGRFVCGYESCYAAARAVNKSPRTIQRALKQRIKAASSYWSYDKAEMIDLSSYKIPHNKIPVYLYSNKGVYECCYDSVSDAARVIQSCTSLISRSIRLGYMVNSKYFSYVYDKFFSNAKLKALRNRPVYQYNLNGEFIAKYANLKEASKALGKNLEINAAIKKGHTCGGFLWSIEKLNYMPNVLQKTQGKARKVGLYTIEGELIKIYRTVTECAKEFPGVKLVLKGRNNTSGGFKFKYIE